MKLIPHHIDTAIKTIDGGSVAASSLLGVKSKDINVVTWSNTFDGYIVRNPVISVTAAIGEQLSKIEINDGQYIINAVNGERVLDQNGVIYTMAELKVGQYLGGITAHTISNMQYRENSRIHQCTGKFHITKITPVEKECDVLYIEVGAHQNFLTDNGIFLRTASFN